jgi:hypothetical protein
VSFTFNKKSVKKAFATCIIEIYYIPGGYTRMTHLMDLEVHTPFENTVSRAITDWIILSDRTKPNQKDVVNWVNESWNKILVSIIKIVGNQTQRQ